MQQPMSLYLLKWCHCLSIKLSQFNGIFNCNQFELFKVSSLIRLESLMVTDELFGRGLFYFVLWKLSRNNKHSPGSGAVGVVQSDSCWGDSAGCCKGA